VQSVVGVELFSACMPVVMQQNVLRLSKHYSCCTLACAPDAVHVCQEPWVLAAVSEVELLAQLSIIEVTGRAVSMLMP
jgi:hypothetical protein